MFFGFLAKPALAQTTSQSTWYNQPFGEWYMKVYDDTNPQEIFGERYTAAQVQWIMWSIPSVMINTIFGSNTNLIGCYVGSFSGVVDLNKCLPDIKAFVEELQSKQITYQSESPSLARIWFKERPLNTVTYIGQFAKNIHVFKEAQAQGGDLPLQNAATGFNYLADVAGLWKITRNMAFGIFVFVIIAFSFMIMFRVKISPQVVITVQSALPKIVIAMILVTFSYAIAGFLIDLSYIVTGFFALLLNYSGGNGTTAYNYAFMTGSLLGLDVASFGTITGLNGLANGPIQIIVYFVLYLVTYIVTTAVLAVTQILQFSVGGSLISALMLIFSIILLIILIINIFRILFLMIKTVANIFLYTILAPIMISGGVLFKGMGFGAWLKKMMANILVFPAVGILFWLAFRFLFVAYRAIGASLVEGSLVIEGIINLVSGGRLDIASIGDGYYEWQVPFMGPGTSAIALIFLSVAVMLLIPKVGKMIEGFFSGRPMDVESAIGEVMGPVRGLGRTASSAATEGATSATAFALMNRIPEGATGLAGFVRNLLGSASRQQLRRPGVPNPGQDNIH